MGVWRKKMRCSIKISGAIPVLLLICGCFWGGNSPETRIYDFGVSAPAKQLPWQVNYQLFRNLSGADRRLLLRNADGKIRCDEFNRWLLDPELLLERYLRNSVSGSGKHPVSVRGTLLAFEMDLQRHEAVLKMDFTLVSEGRRKNISCGAVKRFSAAEDRVTQAVNAMTGCAEEIARQLRKQINLFMEKK